MHAVRLFLALTSLASAACATSSGPASPASANASTSASPATVSPVPTTVVSVDAVEWQDLNPARGDQSPRAGTLWGDRNGTEATGYLLRPVDGFRSPPHIHNVTYRAVVIRGVLHNDDDAAEDMWMPAGSFWTQPKGAPHITAAKGTDTLAYIETDEGPYLVRPIEDAFDTPERPLNVHAVNIVWVPAPPLADEDGAAFSYLWGAPTQGNWHGLFVRLPPGFSGVLSGTNSDLRAVVVSGAPKLTVLNAPPAALAPGSLFSSKGDAVHPLTCDGSDDCVFYVRTRGVLSVTPNPSDR